MGNRNIQCKSIIKREAVDLFLPRKRLFPFPRKRLYINTEKKGKNSFWRLPLASIPYGLRCKEAEQALLTWPESHPGLFKIALWGKVALWGFLADCLTAQLRKVRTATGKVSCSRRRLPENAVMHWCECMHSKPSGSVERNRLKAM